MNDLMVINDNKIVEYLGAMGLASSLTDNEKKQFTEIAVAYQLNPFKREIYCIPYNSNQGRKLSIITGYEVYLKRAERTDKLDGWKCDASGSVNDNTLKAIVTIFRKDWKQPFIHDVFWSEYNQNNAIWKSKPITMIKKVAIAQAFRMCFPDEFGGMPYTADELPDEMTQPKNVTPIETEQTKTAVKDETTGKAIPAAGLTDDDVYAKIDNSGLNPAEKANLKDQYSKKPEDHKKAFYEGCIVNRIKQAGPGNKTADMVAQTFTAVSNPADALFDDSDVPFDDDEVPPAKDAKPYNDGQPFEQYAKNNAKVGKNAGNLFNPPDSSVPDNAY